MFGVVLYMLEMDVDRRVMVSLSPLGAAGNYLGCLLAGVKDGHRIGAIWYT